MAKRHETLAINMENLAIGYGGRELFRPFNLVIPKGTFNVIVGENGSGKSTLLHTICGNLKPIQGNVAINGCDIKDLSPRELAQKLSLVYTDRVNAGGLTVRELIEMGRQPYTGFLGRLNKSDKKIVEEAILEVGIEHKQDCFLSDVSDGERQKAMIARALAQKTPILMLDEPTNFLDAASRLEILSLVARLVESQKITALISTHDISAALALSDNVITIIPSDENSISIDESDSARAYERLSKVFISRGVTFDRASRNYILS